MLPFFQVFTLVFLSTSKNGGRGVSKGLGLQKRRNKHVQYLRRWAAKMDVVTDLHSQVEIKEGKNCHIQKALEVRR